MLSQQFSKTFSWSYLQLDLNMEQHALGELTQTRASVVTVEDT